MAQQADRWIASRSLSSGAHSRDPLARNDDKTYPRDLAAGFYASYSFISRPLQFEGAGNAGARCAPIAACAMLLVERTRVSQVTPESPGTPRAMGYGLFIACSPR